MLSLVAVNFFEILVDLEAVWVYLALVHREEQLEGWEEEEGTSLKPSTPKAVENPAEGLNKKELRKLKAEINQEKSETLKPLKNAMTKIEKDTANL